ncbi:hypothetical protein [Amycolatopsis sp. NPDC021455]|uniref:hypothetical protein n=1 Tax=Amycolatopsis sp. NPDC021455 TaxID=3154901 RepID=UPI0033D684B5
MDVREPALPVDPRLPGEPSLLEVGRTRAWLARRGVSVWLPTRLLALRVGGRGVKTRGTPGYLIGAVCSWLLGGVVFQLADLPGKTAFLAVLIAVFQALRWRAAQRREHLAEQLTGAGAPPPFLLAVEQAGWYLASAAVTFGGGAVLCAASFLTEPRFTWKHWYPPSVVIGLHTFALAVGAGVTTLVLAGVLRGPVIAEDEASRRVDEVLRAEDPYRFAPCGVYAFLAMPVFVVDWATPGFLGWSALAYLLLVAALQLTGWFVTRHRYRRLPPGCYGR